MFALVSSPHALAPPTCDPMGGGAEEEQNAMTGTWCQRERCSTSRYLLPLYTVEIKWSPESRVVCPFERTSDVLVDVSVLHLVPKEPEQVSPLNQGLNRSDIPADFKEFILLFLA